MIREGIAKGGTDEALREAVMMAVMTEIMEGETSRPVKAGSKTGFHRVALYGSGRVLFALEPIAKVLLRHSGESRNPVFSVRSGPRLSPG